MSGTARLESRGIDISLHGGAVLVRALHDESGNMDMTEMQPKDGHVVVVKGGVGVETLAELIGFDFEGLAEELDGEEGVLEEAWGGVIIGGDLTIVGDTTSERLPNGLGGFGEGYPVSDEGYFPSYFIVVLGDLTVDGTLEVEQYRDLYVQGNINVKSYLSTSGNLICSGTLTAQDIICTNATDEGGIFRPSEAVAPAWVSTSDPNYFMFEDLGFENPRVVADDSSPDRVRVREVVSQVLGESAAEDAQLWNALTECVKAGKARDFVEAYRSLPSTLT